MNESSTEPPAGTPSAPCDCMSAAVMSACGCALPLSGGVSEPANSAACGAAVPFGAADSFRTLAGSATAAASAGDTSVPRKSESCMGGLSVPEAEAEAGAEAEAEAEAEATAATASRLAAAAGASTPAPLA